MLITLFFNSVACLLVSATSHPKLSFHAASETDAPLVLIAWSHKASYMKNEPLLIGIKIVNRGKKVVWIGRSIVFHAHVQIRIHDSRGRAYEYPTRTEVVELAPITEKDGFVGLIPGYSYGLEDVGYGQIGISKTGRYTIHVSYADNGDSDYAAKVGITSWSGAIVAQPVTVTVR